MNDPFVGHLTFFRVYSGTLESGTTVMNSTSGKRERIGRILRMHANKREEINECYAGNISRRSACATRAPATRSATRSNPIILEKMDFPEPVISIAIEPKTKADQDKLGVGLQKLAYEDPTLPTSHRRGDRPDHHRRHGRAAPRDHRRPPEARVQGRGQRRQARRSPTARPSPRQVEAEGQVHQADRRPRPVRPRARSASSPGERGTGFVFENEIVGGVIPKEFIPAIEKGIREAHETAACSPATRWSTCKVDALRRQLPRGRLVGAGVRDRRLDGLPGRRQAGRPHPARADHGGRGRDARGLHGRRHRRPQLAPRPDPRHGASAATRR